MAKSKPPKYCIDNSKKKAFVRINGKKIYLPGASNSPESKIAYCRFETEWWENNQRPIKAPAVTLQQGDIADATIGDLVAAYLPQVEGTLKPNEFWNVRTACMDFLIPLYADYAVDSFTPKCLKLVRTSMVQSERFCRKVINGYVKRLVAVFQWGTGVILLQQRLPKGSRLRYNESNGIYPFDSTCASPTCPFCPFYKKWTLQPRFLGKVALHRGSDGDLSS